MVFTCDSIGAFTRWYFQTPSQDVISFNNGLIVSNVSLNESGYYFCFGKYLNRQKNFLARTRLKVYGKKQF